MQRTAVPHLPSSVKQTISLQHAATRAPKWKSPCSGGHKHAVKKHMRPDNGACNAQLSRSQGTRIDTPRFPTRCGTAPNAKSTQTFLTFHGSRPARCSNDYSTGRQTNDAQRHSKWHLRYARATHSCPYHHGACTAQPSRGRFNKTRVPRSTSWGGFQAIGPRRDHALTPSFIIICKTINTHTSSTCNLKLTQK